MPLSRRAPDVCREGTRRLPSPREARRAPEPREAHPALEGQRAPVRPPATARRPAQGRSPRQVTVPSWSRARSLRRVMVPEQRVARARRRPQAMAPARQRAVRAHSAWWSAPAQEQRRVAASGCQRQAAAGERERWRAQQQVERRPSHRGPWQATERPQRRAPPAQDLRAPSARASRAWRRGWAIPPARTSAPGSRRRAAESRRRRAACHPGSGRVRRCSPRAARRGSGHVPPLWPSTEDATDETGARSGPLSRPYVQYDACWSCRCPIDDRGSEAAAHTAIGT
jgi:hypothetical protein